MFTHIPHKKILVTGPQRSGTTICARMIAHDCGLEYIDEDQIGVDNLSLAHELFMARRDIVLQAPALARWCHKLKADLVVFMMRKVFDIVASQERIKWGCEAIELARYGATEGPIARVKYEYWHRVQRPAIENTLEVCFDDLARHKMFEHDRAGFSARQWRREQ